MKRILLVEDEAIVRGPIASLLQREGYEVDVAAAEDEAIRLARASLPDLVMLDVHLESGQTGIQVCERLRATPRMERVPIMMLTSDSQRETVMRCIAAGANDYFLKIGFEFDSLLARIKNWIGGPAPEDPPEPQQQGRW
ncbi:MAG: response regulator transcription factor [candidate division NC10 bacterium]